jgi:hypothetical protein
MMDADQPCLEVGEYEMDDRQEIFGHFRIATFGNIVGVVAALAQSGVAAPIVRRAYRPTFRYPGQYLASGGGLRQNTGDKNLVMDAPAFATGPAADVGFINFDMLIRLAADS